MLITSCVDKAGKGTELTTRSKEALQNIVEDVKKSTDYTNSSLQEIVGNVEKVTTLTKEISTASVEQSEGVTSVNDSIHQMDQVTQQNAATAEEVSSTSEEMTAQAQTLLELVVDLESQVSGTRKDKLQDGKANSAGYEEIKPGAKKASSSTRQSANSRNNGDHGMAQEISSESVIPMGENRITDQSEALSDF